MWKKKSHFLKLKKLRCVLLVRSGVFLYWVLQETSHTRDGAAPPVPAPGGGRVEIPSHSEDLGPTRLLSVTPQKLPENLPLRPRRPPGVSAPSSPALLPGRRNGVPVTAGLAPAACGAAGHRLLVTGCLPLGEQARELLLGRLQVAPKACLGLPRTAADLAVVDRCRVSARCVSS